MYVYIQIAKNNIIMIYNPLGMHIISVLIPQFYEEDTAAVSTKPWWVVKLASFGMPCIQQVEECGRPTYGSSPPPPPPFHSDYHSYRLCQCFQFPQPTVDILFVSRLLQLLSNSVSQGRSSSASGQVFLQCFGLRGS